MKHFVVYTLFQLQNAYKFIKSRRLRGVSCSMVNSTRVTVLYLLLYETTTTTLQNFMHAKTALGKNYTSVTDTVDCISYPFVGAGHTSRMKGNQVPPLHKKSASQKTRVEFGLDYCQLPQEGQEMYHRERCTNNTFDTFSCTNIS